MITNANANMIPAMASPHARASANAHVHVRQKQSKAPVEVLSTQSFYELLSQGRATPKNTFNIQELIVAVDQEVDRGGRLPNEPLDDARALSQVPDPTFEKQAVTIKNLEREIGTVVSKSSQKLFNGKLVVFEDDGGRSFGVKLKGDGAGDNDKVGYGRSKAGGGAGPQKSTTKKHSLANFTPTPSETLALELLDPAFNPNGRISPSMTTTAEERARLASPRPKDKRSSMVTAERKALRQPLTSLYVYGGALVYGVNSKEVNTFSKPMYYFASDVQRRKYFQYEIEMHGFKDEEIFFQTDDSALVIIGYRRARAGDGLNARKVTEVLELPQGLYPENLRVSRIVNGNLVIQQVNQY